MKLPRIIRTAHPCIYLTYYRHPSQSVPASHSLNQQKLHVITEVIVTTTKSEGYPHSSVAYMRLVNDFALTGSRVTDEYLNEHSWSWQNISVLHAALARMPPFRKAFHGVTELDDFVPGLIPSNNNLCSF